VRSAIAAAWSEAWTDRAFRLEFAVALPALAGALAGLASFLDVAEGRVGPVLRDPLLARLTPVDCTWLTFGLIYLGLASGILFLLRHPATLLLTVESYILMVAIRILMMFLVPLDPPAGLIPLADPLVQLAGSGRVPTRDLFFSGHTSTLFLLFLTARGRWLRALFLFCTFVVAGALLWQHVHYAIDVLVAPFVTYACYRLVKLWHADPSLKQGIAHSPVH
jgi:hypothetical protein